MIHLYLKSIMIQGSSFILHDPATLFCTGRLPPAAQIAFLPRFQSRPVSLLWGFPGLSSHSSFTGRTEQEPGPSSDSGGLSPCRFFFVSPDLQDRRKKWECIKLSDKQKKLWVVRGVAKVNKYLLAVQRLSSFCRDDVSLRLSPEETTLYVQICKRLTKLFHSY